MKTNQLLRIVLPSGIEVEALHKTETINLTSLWGQACMMAVKPNANLTQWLASARTKVLVEETAAILGVDVKEVIVLKGRGKARRTWAHINIAVAAMMYLSPKIEAQVIHEFVQGRLFQWRDAGGDCFIDLNATLALNAEEVLGKPAHKGNYINLAKILKQRCGVGDWNAATHECQRHRATLEDRLAAMLRAGVVRDWDHLKELAEKV